MNASLIEQLSARLGVDSDAAAEALDRLVAQLREDLDTQTTVELPGLGSFTRQGDAISFDPDDAVAAAANRSYAGLATVTVGETSASPFALPSPQPVDDTSEQAAPREASEDAAVGMLPENIEEHVTEEEPLAAFSDEVPEDEPVVDQSIDADEDDEVADEQPGEPVAGPAEEDGEEDDEAVPEAVPTAAVTDEPDDRHDDEPVAPVASDEQDDTYAGADEDATDEAPAEPPLLDDDEVAPPGEALADNETEPVTAADPHEEGTETEDTTPAPGEMAPAGEQVEDIYDGERETHPDEAAAAIAAASGAEEAAEEPPPPTSESARSIGAPTDGEPEQRSSRGLLWGILAIVLLIVVVGGYFLLQSNEQAPSETLPEVVEQQAPTEETPPPSEETPSQGEEQSADEGPTQEEEQPAEPSAPETPAEIDPAAGGWTIVVASTTSQSEAESQLESFRASVAGELPVSIVTTTSGNTTRYRVGVGQFEQRAEALATQEQLGGQLPADAWTLQLQ